VSTPSAERSIAGRPYREGDEAGLADLYNRVTGFSRTAAQHRWEWIDPPAGAGSILVIEAAGPSGRRIVGHHGFIPVPLCVFGRQLLGGKTENSMVDPAYRTKLVYFRHERDFLPQALSRFDLLFTTSGAGVPGKIRRQLGYVPVAGYATYVKFTRGRALGAFLSSLVRKRIHQKAAGAAASAAAQAAGFVLIPAFFARPSIDRGVVVREVSDPAALAGALDEFWARSRPSFGVTVDRTSAYLRWRIFENPNIKYRFFAAWRGDVLCGYAAVEAVGGRCKVADLVADGDAEVVWNSVMRGLEARLADLGICRIEFGTLAGGTPLARRLSANGFRAVGALRARLDHDPEMQAELLVRDGRAPIDPRLRDPQQWYFTDLFREGFAGIARPAKAPRAGTDPD
jgi:hypothetical protein